MATNSTPHEPETGYSTLEALDLQPSRRTSNEGLEATHLYGDDTLNGKEVAKEDGLIVAETIPSDSDQRGNRGWMKKRVCGLPMLVFIALVLLLVVGGVVGGALGGTLGKKGSVSTPSPGPTSTVTTGIIGPSSTTASSTTTSSALGFQTPVAQSRWYHILNSDEQGKKVALTAKELEVITVEAPDDSSGQKWFFALVDTTSLLFPATPFYWIGNGNRDPLLAEGEIINEGFVLIGKDSDRGIHIINRLWKSNSLSWWYFAPRNESIAGDFTGNVEWNLWNEKKQSFLGFDSAGVRLTGVDSVSTKWHLEEIGARDNTNDAANGIGPT